MIRLLTLIVIVPPPHPQKSIYPFNANAGVVYKIINLRMRKIANNLDLVECTVCISL